MRLNLSFFKKSAVTGTALALVAGAGMVFFAHANAIQNNQAVSQGPGFELTMSGRSNLTEITPGSQPGSLCDNNRPTAFCRCDNQSAFCKCLKDGDTFCKICQQTNPEVCAICPSNPRMMIACRLFDNNTGNTPGVIQANPNAANVFGSTDTFQAGSSSIPPQPSNNNSGGNTTGSDPNPQPNPGPSGGYCPSNPKMGIACFEPNDPQPNNCAPPRECAVLAPIN